MVEVKYSSLHESTCITLKLGQEVKYSSLHESTCITLKLGQEVKYSSLHESTCITLKPVFATCTFIINSIVCIYHVQCSLSHVLVQGFQDIATTLFAVFKLFVILLQQLCATIYILYLTNVHYFDNEIIVFIDSPMNGNGVSFSL